MASIVINDMIANANAEVKKKAIRKTFIISAATLGAFAVGLFTVQKLKSNSYTD